MTSQCRSHGQLTLFIASGWHREEGCWKASFHAIWRQLVVTKDVAGTIRAATVEAVEQLSEEEPLKSVRQKLLMLSPKSTRDMRGMFVSRDLHAPLNSRQHPSSAVNHAVTIMHYVTSCIKRWQLAIQELQVTCMAEHNMR